ncbi:RsfA family transcriptional regulator [Bacillus taeanensis]|uniref:RsfA family transcriptional regulator n=1 Tax=Bacillus taeanensis TaxID=273032 RepID=A0A366XX12_9BACI|nr:RsfA family transcriptional regulator [Bacillus taeanensis]
MKIRQDAWSHEDDLLLAETVLRHIREGSTQLNAFEEVGDRLNRTSAAVGFRWNAIVRQKYEQAIGIAKKHRKERKRAQASQTAAAPSSPRISAEKTTIPDALSLDDVIRFLTKFKDDKTQSQNLQSQFDKIQKENDQLQKENQTLQSELNLLEEKFAIMQEDYQSVIQIMERARKMILLQEDDKLAPSFKMDKNGNLEKIAK